MTISTTLKAAALAVAVAAPASANTIVDIAAGDERFSTLVAAVTAAGLVETLQGEGPFTVFAPTDEAFAKLPEGTVESLLQPENKDALIAVLTYHVVPGRVTAEQVVGLDEATTVNGADVRIRTRGGNVRINDATVVTTDVFASNGVIHVIDAVLLPPETMSDRNERPMSDRDARRVRQAVEVLSLAIERGVPLFNRGSIDGTNGIYEVAIEAVLAGDFSLPRDARRALERGLRDGRHTHDRRDRAWAYRGGMDAALTAIEGRMAMRTRH